MRKRASALYFQKKRALGCGFNSHPGLFVYARCDLMLTNIVLVYSLLAGMMSILLLVFTLFFEKNKKRSKALLIWSILFLAASFTASEYAFWLEGYNLFMLILKFNFPLIVYFGIWLAFIIWLFEKRKERKIWIIFFILLVAAVLVAINCMNCIRF